MRSLHQRRRALNSGTLPLFDWADDRERRQSSSYPAAWIRRRWPGLTTTIAKTIAELHFGGSR
jgi:hypothetical protein